MSTTRDIFSKLKDCIELSGDLNFQAGLCVATDEDFSGKCLNEAMLAVAAKEVCKDMVDMLEKESKTDETVQANSTCSPRI